MLTTIVTVIFFLFVISYYVLLFKRTKKPRIQKKFHSLSIIIPAHNEELYIEECLESVMKARFEGRKEVIVVDDGSIDNTAQLAGKYAVTLIRTKHKGKSSSMNTALKVATGELIAIVDADSVIGPESLLHMAREVSRKNTAAACCPVRVKNRRRHILMWVHIEQLYNSLMRNIMSKVNANITTPGPLSMYRASALKKIGGFSTQGFSEDVDVTIRLIRKGYRIGFSEKSISETYMPLGQWFFRQRMRFARGMINIFKRHIKANKSIIDLYTLPLLVFIYIQAVIMGSFTIYQIIKGYITWFAGAGNYLSLEVFIYFFNWLSIIGFINWAIDIFTGAIPYGLVDIAGLAAGMLSYPLYFYAIAKYDKKIDVWHIIPLVFMAPFWWFIMIIYIAMLPEIFIRKQHNIWKKND